MGVLTHAPSAESPRGGCSDLAIKFFHSLLHCRKSSPFQKASPSIHHIITTTTQLPLNTYLYQFAFQPFKKNQNVQLQEHRIHLWMSDRGEHLCLRMGQRRYVRVHGELSVS